MESGRLQIQLTKAVHMLLDNFCWLANAVASQPTRITELVLNNPSLLGAYNTAGPGMGGVLS